MPVAGVAALCQFLTSRFEDSDLGARRRSLVSSPTHRYPIRLDANPRPLARPPAALQPIGPSPANAPRAPRAPPSGLPCDEPPAKRAAVGSSGGDGVVAAIAVAGEVDDWRVRSWLSVPADKPAALQRLAEMGVPPSVIPALTRLPLFGPRSGISDADRLLRAVDLQIVEPEQLANGELLRRQ